MEFWTKCFQLQAVESKSKNTKRIPKTQPLVSFSPLSFLSPALAKSQKDDALKPPSFLPFIPAAALAKISAFSSHFSAISLFLLFLSFLLSFFSSCYLRKSLLFSHLSAVSSPFSALHMPPACFSSRSSCCLLFSLGLCPIQDQRKFSFCPSPWSFFSFFVFSSIRFSSKLW